MIRGGRHVGRKRLAASVILSYIGILLTLFLAYHTNTLSWWVALIIGIVSLFSVAGIEYILTYGPIISYREEQISTFLDTYLGLVEEDIENKAPGDVEFRSNVMRPTSGNLLGDRTYEIAYYHEEDDYDKEEFDLEFDIGQGAVGLAHKHGDQKVCISPDHTSSWDDAWDTTARHDRVTSHLNTIIATPIYRPADDPESADPMAVLILDSEDNFDEILDFDSRTDLEDIDIKETEIAKTAVSHARDMGILL